jgi:hypothetical protein
VYQQRVELQLTYHIENPDGTLLVPSKTVTIDREQHLKDQIPLSANLEHGILAQGVCRDVASNIHLQITRLH